MTKKTIECNADKLCQVAQDNHVTLLLILVGDKKINSALFKVSDWIATVVNDTTEITALTRKGHQALNHASFAA